MIAVLLNLYINLTLDNMNTLISSCLVVVVASSFYVHFLGPRMELDSLIINIIMFIATIFPFYLCKVIMMRFNSLIAKVIILFVVFINLFILLTLQVRVIFTFANQSELMFLFVFPFIYIFALCIIYYPIKIYDIYKSK